jgi:hypothetical protein
VITGLPTALTDRIASHLRERLSKRQAGHCVRVDDLATNDARAVAAAIVGQSPAFDVHVLTAGSPVSPVEIGRCCCSSRPGPGTRRARWTTLSSRCR